MKAYKAFSIVFSIFGILLSDIMCAVVAYNWRTMEYGILYEGYSAPANISLVYAIPYLIGIMICLTCAFVFYKKATK